MINRRHGIRVLYVCIWGNTAVVVVRKLIEVYLGNLCWMI